MIVFDFCGLCLGLLCDFFGEDFDFGFVLVYGWFLMMVVV